MKLCRSRVDWDSGVRPLWVPVPLNSLGARAARCVLLPAPCQPRACAVGSIACLSWSSVTLAAVRQACHWACRGGDQPRQRSACNLHIHSQTHPIEDQQLGAWSFRHGSLGKKQTTRQIRTGTHALLLPQHILRQGRGHLHLPHSTCTKTRTDTPQRGRDRQTHHAATCTVSLQHEANAIWDSNVLGPRDNTLRSGEAGQPGNAAWAFYGCSAEAGAC